MTEPRGLITKENDSKQSSFELADFGCILQALSSGISFWHLFVALSLSEQIRDGRS